MVRAVLRMSHRLRPTNIYQAIVSGLRTIAPFPNHDDVCRSVDETSVPTELVKDRKMLIACPKHEIGALEDRIRQGAKVIAHAKHWTVLDILKPYSSKRSGYSDQLSKKNRGYDDHHVW